MKRTCDVCGSKYEGLSCTDCYKRRIASTAPPSVGKTPAPPPLPKGPVLPPCEK